MGEACQAKFWPTWGLNAGIADSSGLFAAEGGGGRGLISASTVPYSGNDSAKAARPTGQITTTSRSWAGSCLSARVPSHENRSLPDPHHCYSTQLTACALRDDYADADRGISGQILVTVSQELPASQPLCWSVFLRRQVTNQQNTRALSCWNITCWSFALLRNNDLLVVTRSRLMLWLITWRGKTKFPRNKIPRSCVLL